jgi:hypothetical protein
VPRAVLRRSSIEPGTIASCEESRQHQYEPGPGL